MNVATFPTTDIRLAASLATAGFGVLCIDRVRYKDKDFVAVDFEAEHNGIFAKDLATRFEDANHRPDGVIEAASKLSPRELTLLTFDHSRAAHLNRLTLLKAAPRQPLEVRKLPSGAFLYVRG